MNEGVYLGSNKAPLSMEIRSDWGKVFDEKILSNEEEEKTDQQRRRR